MSRLPIASVILAVLVCSSVGKAQSVQVSPQNRTIEIAANSSIEVTADQVTITVGYHNYGSTQRCGVRGKCTSGYGDIEGLERCGRAGKGNLYRLFEFPRHRRRGSEEDDARRTEGKTVRS